MSGDGRPALVSCPTSHTDLSAAIVTSEAASSLGTRPFPRWRTREIEDEAGTWVVTAVEARWTERDAAYLILEDANYLGDVKPDPQAYSEFQNTRAWSVVADSCPKYVLRAWRMSHALEKRGERMT